MDQDPFQGKKLTFPLRCHFKIIASEDISPSSITKNAKGEERFKEVQGRIEKVLKELAIKNPLEAGSLSKQGNYLTFNLDCMVHSDEELRRIDRVLRAVEGVKMIL